MPKYPKSVYITQGGRGSKNGKVLQWVGEGEVMAEKIRFTKNSTKIDRLIRKFPRRGTSLIKI